MKIDAISALTDNYIWAITIRNNLTVIDPGDSDPVIDFINLNKLQLTNILITHHHVDHIGGIQDLLSIYPNISIYGPKPCTNSPQTTVKPYLSSREITINHINTQSNLTLTNHLSPWEIIETPGHTLDHLCYYQSGYLFSGDTLFSAGCGRVFSGTVEQLYHSVRTLSALPDNTNVYPGHEYTISNLKFAEYIEPENINIRKARQQAEHQAQIGKPTLPSSIAHEKKINPFMRAHEHSIRERVINITNRPHASTIDVFKSLRNLKDNFIC